jgi:DNA-binding Xre family transcriptional regulator
MNKHIGNSFDDFLEEEGLLAETESVAIKRVFAYQVAELMKKKKLSKVAMASKMNTSRSALDRLLDPQNTSITLQTMERAAHVMGKRLRIDLA